MNPTIQPFWDANTSTTSYVVYEKPGTPCAIIDSVLDYDAKSGQITHHNANKIIDFVHSKNLRAEWILETHVHADHVSAAAYLKHNLGGKIALGLRITEVQKIFKETFNLEPHFPVNGAQFDRLLQDQEVISCGALTITAISVPGHTPACMAYQIGGTVFVGDTLFMPDVGTARCDFPGGNAHALYHSIRKLLALPLDTQLLMCHDYPPTKRAISWLSTVAEQRKNNIHVHDDITEQNFVAMRTQRDATLDTPTLMLPAIQLNIRAGELPSPENNGRHYLKIPLTL